MPLPSPDGDLICVKKKIGMSKELPEIQWKCSVERYRVSGIRCDWKGRQWSVIRSLRS